MIAVSTGRQDVIVGHACFDFTEAVRGEFNGLIKVPTGALVLNVSLTLEGFESGGGDDEFEPTFSFPDGDIEDPYYGTLVRATDFALNSPGYATAPTEEDYLYGFTWAGSGTMPTEGKGAFVVQYILHKRAHTSQD